MAIDRSDIGQPAAEASKTSAEYQAMASGATVATACRRRGFREQKTI
jgi:hypothetical protein